jgi:murein DD-endopeptidase MepM/ murein hydrolase activator NlpD
MTVAAVALPAAAGNPHQRLQEIQDRRERLQQMINRVDANGDSVSSIIAHLDHQRASVAAQVRRLDGRIAVLDGRIAKVQADLQEAQTRLALLTRNLERILGRLDARTDVFVARAVAAYKAGPTAEADSLLSAHSFGDLMDRYAYYQSALDSDSSLVDEISGLRDRLDERRQLVVAQEHQIAQTKLRLEASRTEVAAVRGQRADELAAKQAVIAQKNSLLNHIRGHQQKLQAQEVQLERASARIHDFLARQASTAAPSALPTGGGQLLWPAAGPVTSPFGYRIDPVIGGMHLHAGIDIGAPYGATVVAADSGTVAYVGVISGYGNVVAIDHGGGLSTTYNHLSAWQVSTGQHVSRGQPIANVGCTGYCTGPHLHFEVRINGTPVDPMPYLQ